MMAAAWWYEDWVTIFNFVFWPVLFLIFYVAIKTSLDDRKYRKKKDDP